MVTLLLGLACWCEAAQFVIVLQQPNNAWQVVEAEKLTVNQKDKVRVAPAGQFELRPDAYKKAAPVEMIRMGVVRRHASGCLVRRASNGWETLLPDGAAFKGSAPCAAMWASAAMAWHADRASKAGTKVEVGKVFAILPGPDRGEAIANLLVDEANFRGLGEKDASASFNDRMNLLVAVAGSVTGPASEKIQRILLAEMTAANQNLSAGIARSAELDRGLVYVQISQKAYPNDKDQAKARQALTDKKTWLDQRKAILKALNAASLWDAFLDKYGDFERWDNSFEEFRKMRSKAYQESTAQHKAEGKRMQEAKQYSVALRELKLAKLRSPADVELDALIDEVSILEARDYAQRVQRTAEDPRSPRQTIIRRNLNDAETYISQKRFAEAEEAIRRAEAQDKDAPPIMLRRAKLLHASGSPLKALELLNRYERRVTAEDEIAAGDQLRSLINIELSTNREKLKTAIKEAAEQGDYVAAYENAQAGLTLDSNDLDFLYHAGLHGAMVRKPAEAIKNFEKFQQISQVLTGKEKQRAEVYNFITRVNQAMPEPEGIPNWFSGYKSPRNVFYCPISLQPNAKVSDIKASRKQGTMYQWNGDQLSVVRTTTTEPGERDFTVNFEYFKEGKGVRRVSAEPFAGEKEENTPQRFTPKGTTGPGKGAYTALLNHPAVNPVLVEALTGKRVATLVAGNPFFHPFVWSGIYSFIAEYDEQGRVKSAREITSGQANASPHQLAFKWEGNRLMEVTESGSGYRRTMTYAGDKLMTETISYRAKTGKIEYKYRGDQLLEAICSEDISLDGRSRRVVFR